MRSNKNWMCAADYTCILIRIVWTPFLLSVTHTHAIRKMVCQKRLESVCGKKQAPISGWFVVVDLRTAHVVDLRPIVGLAGCHLPLYCLRLSIWAEFSLCQFWLDNWTMWSRLTFAISSVDIRHSCNKDFWNHFSCNKDMHTTISFSQTHYVIIFLNSIIILCTQPIKLLFLV